MSIEICVQLVDDNEDEGHVIIVDPSPTDCDDDSGALCYLADGSQIADGSIEAC